MVHTHDTLIIRSEEPRDIAAVHSVNEAAFGRPDEAKLVDALRDAGAHLVSLVAELDGAVVGHILFSPAHIEEEIGMFECAGLAPMAVSPEHQRSGIGGRLIESGLAACRERGIRAVIVLGHPAYYPRFGFRPANAFGVSCEYDAPPEAFMILELEPGAIESVSGIARYHPVFGRL